MNSIVIDGFESESHPIDLEDIAMVVWEKLRMARVTKPGVPPYDELGELTQAVIVFAIKIALEPLKAHVDALLAYTNASVAVESFFLNGMPPNTAYNDDLVEPLRAAYRSVISVPGVIPDPYNDEAMWAAIND
jgi:hypothetical protein